MVSRTGVDYSVSTNKSIVILLGACLAQSALVPKTLRLYIFDCGTIHTSTVDAYSLKKEEVGSTEMAIPCRLVAHPKGTLRWDKGDIPDRAFPPGGGPASAGVVTQDKPLLPQLAAVGYTPADITYLAMSHYHGDHVANASAGSTWLVCKVERDRMFSGDPILRSDPANYSSLKDSKTVIIDQGEHARPPGVVSDAGQNRALGPERRSLSSSGGAHARPSAGGRVQQGPDGRLPC